MKRILQVLLVVVALCAAVVLFLVVSHAMEDQRAYKPVLYLYPEQEQAVTVALDLEGTLDTVYPAPDQAASADGRTRASWTVDAAPDGTLTDASGREYPSLFWDATMALPEPDSGFVVSRDEAVPFLEDKLAELGLSDREAADFITYWAPRIRSHEYTFVSFDASAYTQRASYGFTDASGEHLICPASNGMFRPLLVDRGRVVGVRPVGEGLLWLGGTAPSARAERDATRAVAAVEKRLAQ